MIVNDPTKMVRKRIIIPTNIPTAEVGFDAEVEAIVAYAKIEIDKKKSSDIEKKNIGPITRLLLDAQTTKKSISTSKCSSVIMMSLIKADRKYEVAFAGPKVNSAKAPIFLSKPNRNVELTDR